MALHLSCLVYPTEQKLRLQRAADPCLLSPLANNNPRQFARSEWYGVIFVHQGYYRKGIFKFIIDLPRK